MDRFWYLVAKEFFVDKDYISTATLQRFLKIPYFQARLILNELIKVGFCEQQNGSLPCKILRVN